MIDARLIDRALAAHHARRAARGNPPVPDPGRLSDPQLAALAGRCLDLMYFTRLFWPLVEPERPFVPGWHLGCVAEHLKDVSDPTGSIKNLIINVPPRCTKSLLVCVFWFAWAWTQWPWTRWMFSSFAGDLVGRDSKRCRDLVRHPLYQRLWDVRIKADHDTQTRFTNTYEGFRYAVTVGGQGMGEGADFIVCFPYNTPVETDAGPLPIGRVVEERLPVRVLAFDHDAGRPVWRAVEEYESRPGRPAVRVRFSNGAEFAATDDHPVFVTGLGYVPAAALVPGDEVVTREAEPDVSGLPETVLSEAGPRGPVQGGGVLLAPVSREGADGGRESRVPGRPAPAAVPDVPQAVQGRPVGSGQVAERGAVLLAGVPREVTPRGGEQPVRPGQAAVRLLLPADHEAGRAHGAGVLRPAVCEHVPRGGHVGGRESAVRQRPIGIVVPGRIPPGPAGDSDAGREPVPPVRDDGGRTRVGAAGPPRQLRQGGQPAGEPRDGLQVVPRADARKPGESLTVGTAVVVSVERVSAPDRVYNVRVAVNHNYFAAGVLVHNCDDPINPKKARSAVERANCIYWWRTTMARRVTDERTARRVLIMQRLHEQDLTGYLVAEQAGWDHLVLPMRYEPRRYLLPDPPAPEAIVLKAREAAQTVQASAGPPPATELPHVTLRGRDDAPIAPEAAATPDAYHKALAALHAAAAVVDAAPRDAIRLTALQLKRPELRDGPGGSGRTEAGQLLWPTRFPEPEVARAEIEYAQDAAGQYQQRPSGESGDIFRREYFRRWEPVWDEETDAATGVTAFKFGGVKLYGPDPDAPPRTFRSWQLTFFQTIDTALTEGKRSAFTAVATAFATPEFDLGLWHVFRGRLEVQYQFGLLAAIRSGPVAWSQKTHTVTPMGAWPFRLAFQAVERKASGIGLIQEGARSGVPFHPLQVDGDKVQRAVPVASMYVNGKVYHPPPGRPWIADLEDELALFPNGTYKDQADVVAYAGYLVTHDAILRGLCTGRVMADALDPAEAAAREAAESNVVRVPTPHGDIEIDFGDDDGPFGQFGSKWR